MQIQLMRSLQAKSRAFGDKEKIMIRKQKEDKERKQLGVKIDSALWTQMKILALEQGRTAGELLEDAMREYQKKHGRSK